MASQVVKIRREALAACMTCPLCDKLLREATTISLCLHTFCRKCIYDKLSDDEIDCCPVCEIDLGCVPEDKLRPDHNLQDLRAKIFPSKRTKIKSPEVTPSVTPPVKRKERSLSSLVVSAPKVSSQTGVTGKRSKSGARKNASSRATSFGIEKSIKKQDFASVDCPESSSSDEMLHNTEDKEQSSPPTKPIHQQLQIKDDESHTEIQKPNIDLWKPLNCLVEAANRTKLSKISPQDMDLVKSEPTTSTLESKVNGPKFKGKESVPDKKVELENNGKPLIPKVVKRRRRRAIDRNIHSPQSIVDSCEAKPFKRAVPIWLSLVPTEDQERDDPLPQRPACYLRVKDCDVPVSFIQKYLVKKLGLKSENEVDVVCHGQPVIPTLRLKSLVDLCSQLEPQTKKSRTRVGSTAKDFVMALSYNRKIIPILGKQ